MLDAQAKKDCAAVILFNHGVSPTFSGCLTPASDIAAGSTSMCQKAVPLTLHMAQGADASVTKSNRPAKTVGFSALSGTDRI